MVQSNKQRVTTKQARNIAREVFGGMIGRYSWTNGKGSRYGTRNVCMTVRGDRAELNSRVAELQQLFNLGGARAHLTELGRNTYYLRMGNLQLA